MAMATATDKNVCSKTFLWLPWYGCIYSTKFPL